MAKKNKKGKRGPDLRGYSGAAANGPSQTTAEKTKRATTTNTTASSSIKVQVSSETHEELKNLLGHLQSSTSHFDTTTAKNASAINTTTAAARSDRFSKRLANISDQLLGVGFQASDLENVCRALGYAITLESALDWFCLHYDTEQLPALLTEGAVRDTFGLKQKNPSTNKKDPLTVLVASMTTSTASGFHDYNLRNEPQQQDEHDRWIQSASSFPNREIYHENDGTEPTRTAMSTEEKAWLLQQYQYVDDTHIDDDDESAHAATTTGSKVVVTVSADANDMDGHDDQNPEPNQVTASASTASVPSNPALSDAVDNLQMLQQELEEAERDARDEASNYMRSKLEIKELQKRAKQLQKQVQKAQSKVDRLTALQEEDIKIDDDNQQEDEHEGGGWLNIFEQGNNDEASVDKTETATVPSDTSVSHSEAQQVVLPRDAIPATWTGKTPTKILEEDCRKQKWPKPIYHKLSQDGCRIRVRQPASLGNNPSELVLEEQGPLTDYKLAQEYMAVRALYEIHPTLPLYRLFPPFFRDLWKSWVEAEQQAKDTQTRQEVLVKQATITRLIQLIGEAHPGGNSDGVASDEHVADHTKEAVAETDEPWEYENDDSTANLQDETLFSKIETQLRDDFLARQKSPAYQAMLQERSSLPIFSFRDKILETIESEPVTIITADTGAGKSTQCPQFILEQALSHGKGNRVSILCTQPRRVAAISVAERVSVEMAEKALGQTVGYQIRLEAKRSSQTKLLFCTTGIVLRRLQDVPTLKGVTHVVVDEVHERQYQIDVLLIALRRLVSTERRDLKVVLMSATLDADLFCAFFNGAPLVKVPGRTFPVSNYFLEDLFDATDYLIEEQSPYAIRNYSRVTTASLMVTGRGGEKRKQTVALESEVGMLDVSDDFLGYKLTTRRSMDRVNEERINYDLIEDVLRLLLFRDGSSLKAPDGVDLSHGSILIFLPGIGEIRTLSERLEASRDLGNRDRFDVLPLHSSLSAKDQRRAFAKPKRGCRKIIVSTNIAETSVTIPDVVCVIDSGRVREVRQNKRTSTSMLATDWCSRASAKQRSGRAGRVQPGICLKLFSSRTYKHVMKEASEPELRRVPLEEVCLTILASGFAKSCMEFLRQAPQPPTDEAVQSALQVLHEVGALALPESTIEDASISKEVLTPLGYHLAKLPVHVRLGKMLIFGALFRCMDPILTVAASLSCQSPFASFWSEANEAKAKHKSFAHNQSDFLTACNVWNAYCKAVAQGPSHARLFCREHYLSLSALNEIRDTREHFVDLLCGIGFLDRNRMRKDRRWFNELTTVSTKSPYDKNSQNINVMHAVICAGLYPNVAHLLGSPSSDRQLWHNQQRLYMHSSSVNAKLTSTHGPSAWITFHEKFETSRVYVSTTSPIHPFAMLIFGRSILVKHLERKVVVDDWIELGIAAQTGVMFREVREQISKVLELMIQDAKGSHKKHPSMTEGAGLMVEGIVKLLTSDSATYGD